MPNYSWKGRTRGGKIQEGVLVAESKEAAIATPAQAADHRHRGDREGQGVRPAQAGRRDQQQGDRDLHPAVLGDDRRRTAAGAVPGDPRLPAGEPDVPEDPVPGAAGRGDGVHAGRRPAQAPQGVRRPVLQHGRRRRGRRYPGHHPAAPFAPTSRRSSSCARPSVRRWSTRWR